MQKAKHLLLKLTFLFLLLFSNSAYSQIEVYNTPLDTIKSLVEEAPEIISFLNELILNPDSTISQDDYFYLYYGSAFYEAYSPYGEGLSNTEMNELFDEKKYDEIIEVCQKTIKENPAYMKPFYNMGIAYEYQGDSTMAKMSFERYYELLRVPFFSGNGETEETAFVVRTVDDEYNIIYEMDLTVISQALVYGENGIPYDVLTVKEKGAKEGETKEMYFNIYLPFKIGMKKMFSGVDLEDDKKDKKEEEKSKKKKRKKKRKEEKAS